MYKAPDKDLFSAGTVINRRYEILGVTGRSLSTVVYAAQDSVTKKTVSLKAVSARHMPDSSFVGRLQQEARILSRLRHQSVIRMIDFGTSESGQAFLVTDYLEGQRLSAVVRQENGLIYERALPIFAQICDALQAIHADSIVHRDFGPDRILVVSDENQYDLVKLIDFETAIFLNDSPALAKQLSPAAPPNDAPCFNSPEQLRGRKVVDTRADIFSLGCLMYFVLLGSPPYTAGELRQAVSGPEFLPRKKFSDCRPDLPPVLGVEDVVRRALELDPADRWQTIEQVLDSLLFTAGSVSLAWLDSLSEKPGN